MVVITESDAPKIENQRTRDAIDSLKTEDRLILDILQSVSKHANDQIDKVMKFYALAATLISLVFIFGIGIFTYLYHKNIDEMRRDLNTQAKSMSQDLSKEVHSRIDKELKQEDLRNLVDIKVKDSVDRVSDKYIEDRVKSIVDSDGFQENLKKLVDDRSQSIIEEHVKPAFQEISNLTKELKDYNNIIGLFYKARAGDSAAYFELVESSKTASDPLKILRLSLLSDLRSFLQDIKYRTYGQIVTNPKTSNIITIPVEHLYYQYLLNSGPGKRQAGINDIRRRQLKYFIEDLVRISSSDPNLVVRVEAARAIEAITNRNFDIEPTYNDIIEWWDKSGKSIDEYKSPFVQLASALTKWTKDKDEQGLQEMERITAERQGFGITHYEIAKFYQLKHDIQKTKDHLKRVVDECEGVPEPYFMYIKILANEGDKDGATKVLVKLKPFIDDLKKELEDRQLLGKLGGEGNLKDLLN
jgi:hypothetical protein